MSSQLTYQSRLGKFSGGLEVLGGITSYNPSREELKLASLLQLKTDAEAKNAAVVTTGTALKDLRNRRSFMSFRSKDSDTNCIENLCRNSRAYISAELGKKNGAYLKIDSTLKKLHPVKDKKEDVSENAEPVKSRSKSEKSYKSLVGFGRDVVTILNGLGEKYAPSNENITPANILAAVNELAELNASITQAELAYTNAVTERKEVYDGEFGITKVIARVKDYLSSFEGGINNPDYAAFSNAVK